MVTQVVEELGVTGGLFRIGLSSGIVFYMIVMQPFRDLDLAVSHSKLKDQICRQEGLLADDDSLDTKFKH